MQRKPKQNFVFVLLELILKFFSGVPDRYHKSIFCLITNELFLWLSTSDQQLLSAPKVTTLLASPLLKFHEPPLSNVIPPYTTFSFIIICFLYLSHERDNFLIWNCQEELLVKHLNHRQFKYLQFWLCNCFIPQLKGLYRILFPFHIRKI